MWQVVREDDCSYKKCLYSSELIHKNIVNINHMREPTENVFLDRVIYTIAILLKYVSSHCAGSKPLG